MEFYEFMQFLASNQMKYVKNYATSKGMLIKGDIPFLVSKDSADIWYVMQLHLSVTGNYEENFLSPTPVLEKVCRKLN